MEIENAAHPGETLTGRRRDPNLLGGLIVVDHRIGNDAVERIARGRKVHMLVNLSMARDGRERRKRQIPIDVGQKAAHFLVRARVRSLIGIVRAVAQGREKAGLKITHQPLCLSCGGVVQVVASKQHPYLRARRPQQLPSERSQVLAVSLVVESKVRQKIIAATNVHGYFAGDDVPDERAGVVPLYLHQIVGAVRGRHAPRLRETRRRGADQHGPARHVSAEQRALRTAEHFDALQIVEIRAVISKAGCRHFVDEDGHTLVDAGGVIADGRPANGNERLGVVHLIECNAWGLCGYLAEVEQVLPLNFAAVDDRYGDRGVLEFGFPPLRGDQHLLKLGAWRDRPRCCVLCERGRQVERRSQDCTERCSRAHAAGQNSNFDR